MKTLTFIFLLLIATATASFGQARSVQQFYDHYKKLETVTDVRLQGWVLELAARFSDEETAERLLKKITQLRVLVMEEGNLVEPEQYRSFIRNVKKERFEELFQIREDGNHVNFLIREDGDTITDVLITVSGEDGFVLLSLEGALQFSDLNDLELDINGAEHFKRLPDEKKKVPRA